jgi:hypothetical protein
MPTILSMAFGSSVPDKPTEISFDGHQFHIWAVLEIVGYIIWYFLHPASFVFAVSVCINRASYLF